MQKAVILIRKPGVAVPDEILNPLFAKYNQAIGFAMADGSAVRVTRGAKTGKWTPSAKSFKEGDKAFSDRQVVYCFMDITDDKFNNADLQPYVAISDDKNNPLAVVFMDGEFIANTDGVNRHAQALAFEKHIQPILAKAYKGVDKNLEQFIMDELTDDMLGPRLLQCMSSDNGSVLILTATDEALTYTPTDDKSSHQYDWGWVSNTEFLGEQKPETAPAEPAKEEDDNPFHKAAEATPAATPAPAASGGGFRRRGGTTPSVPATPTVVVDNTRKPEDVDKSNEVTLVQVSLPKGVDRSNSKGMGNFLRARHPDPLPEDWLNKMEKGFTIELSRATAKLLEDIKAGKSHVKVFKQVGGLEALAQKFNSGPAATTTKTEPTTTEQPATPAAIGGGFRRRGAGSPATSEIPSQTAPEGKDVSTHELGNKRPGIVPKVWLIPPAEKQDMIAFMNDPKHEKALDRNSQTIPDPTTFIELDQQSFAKQLGLKGIPDIWSTVNWDEDVELPMIQNAPHTAMAYVRDWKKQAIKYRHLALELEGRKQQKEEAAGPSEQPKEQATGGGFRRRR